MSVSCCSVRLSLSLCRAPLSCLPSSDAWGKGRHRCKPRRAYKYSVSFFPWTEIVDRVASSGSKHEPHICVWQRLDSDLSVAVRGEYSHSVNISYELHFSLTGFLWKIQSVTAWAIPGPNPPFTLLHPDVVYQDSLLQILTVTPNSWSPLAINSPGSWWPLSEWQSTGHLSRLELQ